MLLLCTACGSGGSSTPANNIDLETASVDTSDEAFRSDHLLQVDIQMDPAEYELLRQEGRQLAEVATGCAGDFAYTHFQAAVTIDGKLYRQVDIRKKGFIGSLSASRPSFKLNFDALKPDREVFSMTRLTLNNNNQDASNTHQCIAYNMFRKAGLPAPRCSLARVSVNGEDLGIYSNVESIEDRFLARNFGNSTGNLYEAQIGDFGEFLKEGFQSKNNRETNDRRDLDAVVDVLAMDDESMPALLENHVNLDEFLSYWAMEAVTGHWDSATGNANNHFLYHNAEDDRFYYIPWGTDGALELDTTFAGGSGPLYRTAIIPSRLYQIPKWRNRYHKRILDLLDTVWDSEALHAEADQIRDLTGTDENELARVREFIDLHPQRLRDAVAGKIPQEERYLVDAEQVCDPGALSYLEGSFGQGLANYRYGNAEGEEISVTGVITLPSEEGIIPIGEGISTAITGQSSEGLRILVLSIEAGEFGPGTIPTLGFATTFFLIGEQENGELGPIGISGEGSITLEEPAAVGVPLTGTISADLWLTQGDGFGPFAGEGSP